MILPGQGGVSIWAESRGPADGEVVLLISGLSMQAIDWPEDLLNGLAARFRTVIFDNRDTGLSGRCGPDTDEGLAESDFPTWDAPKLPPPYTLFDMAEDARALLDSLGVKAAHVVGYSMGGMIGQILAARHPERVASLTSLMSSGGEPWIDATPAVQTAFARSILTIADPDKRLERLAEEGRVFIGPGMPFDLDEARNLARISLARAYFPAGIWRQARAMRGSGDRTALLRTIRCPTLVVHGECDPCIAVAQGRAAAALIPNAVFVELPGIGHDLPPVVVERLASLLPQHMSRAARS